MGKIVEKKKKKKGRPSLLDLQKRSLKQQQQQQQQQKHLQLRKKSHSIQNPTPKSNSGVRRSTRRNPNPNPNSDNDSDEYDDQHSSHKRRQKRLKHVLKLSDAEGDLHSGAENSEPDSNQDEEGNTRKRKIDSIAHGSGFDNDYKSQKHSAATNHASIHQGLKINDGPSTPLPDKKLLLFIIDRLQKKDTYGVFSDPVDTEELPDYLEVIQYPMDFSTIRKKLADDVYTNLEQFEKDVFLLCSNAMQYNSPDTIYFRQARAIQELAKKNFENLRQDSDNEPEPEPVPEPEPKVARRGRPPNKKSKKTLGRPPLERGNSNFSEGTPPSTGGNSSRLNNDMRKGPSALEKQRSADLFARSLLGPRCGEPYIARLAERYERSDDMTGSASKGISFRHGRKNIVLDESKRNTYNQICALACGQEASVLTTFDGERKLLIPVGLHTEYGYARSLSRFAAKLGHVAWKVASRKIERCLPVGVKFGLGWVGENEVPAEKVVQQQLPVGEPSPPGSLPKCGDSSSTPAKDTVEPFCDKSTNKPLDGQLPEVPSSSNESKFANGPKVSLSDTPEENAGSYPNTTSNILNSSVGAIKPGYAHQNSHNQPRINGLNSNYGLNFVTQMSKMIGAARPSMSNLQSNPPNVTVSRTETRSLSPQPGDNNGSGKAKLLENSSTVMSNDHQKAGSGAPDLNVGFQSSGSSGSQRADSVHPDLALQL